MLSRDYSPPHRLLMTGDTSSDLPPRIIGIIPKPFLGATLLAEVYKCAGFDNIISLQSKKWLPSTSSNKSSKAIS